MKLQLLTWLSLILISSFASAEWTVLHLKGSDLPDGYRSMSIVEKMIRTPYGSFSTGTITNAVVPLAELKKNNLPDLTPDQIAEEVRRMMKAPKWEHAKVEGLDIYTLRWKEQRRLFRLVIQKDRENLRKSFAVLRAPYAIQEALESALLQRGFFTIEKRNSKKTAQLPSRWPSLLEALVPEAQAGEFSTDQIRQAYEGFMNRVYQTSTGFGSQAATTLASSLNGLQATGQGMANQLNGTAQSAITAVNGVSASVNKASDTARYGIDTAKNQLKFWNMAKSAAGLTFGMGLGSELANITLSGGAKLMREAYYFATGKMKDSEKAEVEARSNKAMKDWEEGLKQLEDLEQQMSMYEMAISSATEVPAGMLIENGVQAQAMIRELENRIAGLEKTLSNTSDANERMNCSKNLVNLGNELTYLKLMYSIMAKSGRTDKPGTLDLMCGKLQEMLNNWMNIEARLHEAKMTISQEMVTLLGALKEGNTSAVSNPVRERPRNNNCEKIDQRQISVYEDQYKKACERVSPDPDCVGFWNQIQEKRREMSRCQDDLQSSQNANNAYSYQEALRTHNEQIKNARAALDAIKAADCREGEKLDGVCDVIKPGETGILVALKKRYQEKKLAYSQKCSNILPPSDGFGVSKQSYDQGMADQSRDFRPEGRKPQTVSKPSIFSRIGQAFSSIKNFFTGFFK